MNDPDEVPRPDPSIYEIFPKPDLKKIVEALAAKAGHDEYDTK